MNVCKPLVVAALFTTSGCTTIEQVVIETEATYVQINAADKSTTVRLGPGPGHEKSAQAVDILEYEPLASAEDLSELQQQLNAQKAKAQLYGTASLAAMGAPKKSIASKVPVILGFLLPFLPIGIFVSRQTGRS